MKKRILLLLLCVTMVLLSACNTGDHPDEPPVENKTLFSGADTDYSLVYPAGANETLKGLVIDLRGTIADITGTKPDVYTDDTAKKPEQTKEILIGNTSRAQSKQSSDALAGNSYRVEWIGEKLVITGSNDEMIKLAIEDLVAAATKEGSTFGVVSNLSLTKTVNEGYTNLLDSNGKMRYVLVIPKNASNSLLATVMNFRDDVQRLTGTRPNMVEGTQASTTEYEILIGDTGRDASNALFADMGYFDYQIKFQGTRLVVAALSDTQVENALQQLLSDLRALVASSYDGQYLLSNEYSKVGSLLSWADEIPMAEGGNFGGVYDEGDNTFVINQTDVQKTDYEAYLNKLTAAGYTKVETYDLSGNVYTLLNSSTTTLYASYLPQTNGMHVYAEKAGNAVYPTVKAETTGGQETPTFWMLMSDYQGSQHNGGSSFVMRLTDGTYVIVDGGYDTDAEADQLYNVLMEDTPEGEKPVVSMWFITHPHTDHYGCLLNFSERYSDKVDVKAFGYNFAPGMGGTPGSVKQAMNKWSDAVQYNKLHSGMTIGFADAKATIICTQEDIYPREATDINDTCMVVRMDIGGQRIMFLADAYEYESKTMSATIPVAELKSDMVQIAHHGYEGCLRDLYDKIGARVGLWTMSIYGYKMDTVANVFEYWMDNTENSSYPYPNNYLITQSSIEQFLVDGAGTVKLELPYTDLSLNNKDGFAKNGSYKLPDYKAIYNEIKARAPRG